MCVSFRLASVKHISVQRSQPRGGLNGRLIMGARWLFAAVVIEADVVAAHIDSGVCHWVRCCYCCIDC
jgi:hypothetical protein